ncbi:MAG: AmpG family muropeptide MFS transporter [Rhodospirillales bacterium]
MTQSVADKPPTWSQRFAAWRHALAIYRDPRMLVVLGMGFASGLPLLLTLSTLSYWLSKVGVDKTSIGLFSLVGIPYAFKFAWSPLVDHLHIPVLGRLLGRRRSWILVTQIALAAAIVAMGWTDPQTGPLYTAIAALVVAFLSATQDIAIDAYRIEILTDDEQGGGAAATQLGYRLGLLAAGAGALALSDVVEWRFVFIALGALMATSIVITLLAPEPQPVEAPRDKSRALPPLIDRLKVMVLDPLLDFMRRPASIVILAFVLLYKFGDAIGGVMANPFYNELGFTGLEIAAITKIFGVVATLAGVAIGGIIVARYGVMRALLVGGILQAVSNLLFSLQALIGHDTAMLAVSIGGDNFTGGIGSAAFVAYLSMLCNRAFTATQYALLTSFMAVGRTLLASGGGWLADNVDWVSFFALTALLAIPGLLLLFYLWRLDRKPSAAQRIG